MNKEIENSKKRNWEYALPKKYHCFSGDYHGFKGKHGETFRFVATEEREVSLCLAPPLARKNVSNTTMVVVTARISKLFS